MAVEIIEGQTNWKCSRVVTPMVMVCIHAYEALKYIFLSLSLPLGCHVGGLFEENKERGFWERKMV